MSSTSTTETSAPAGTHVLSTSGVALIRHGKAGCALRWDARAQCWRWADPQGGQLHAWPAPAGATGAVRLLENARVVACSTSGRVLLGLGKRLGMVELPAAPPGQVNRPLQAQVLITVDAAEARTSISDGCTDRSGNFVFGTANTAADRRPIGSFYQYSHRHGLRRLALPVVVTAGGIAFSADGHRMYFADTARGAIMRCDYDAERAKVGGVRTFTATVGQGAGAGTAVVDSAGDLWSVQDGALAQYDDDGQLRRQLSLAREAIAGVAFGGEAMRQMLLLGTRGGLYGVPAEVAAGLAPGLADTLFDDDAR